MENYNTNLPNNSVPSTKLSGPIMLLRQAWEIYKNRFWVLLGITLLPTALMIIYFIVVAGSIGTVGFLTVALSLGVGVSHGTIIAGLILAVLVYIAIIFVSFWAQTALVFAIKGADQKIGFKESFKQSSHKIGSFFGAALLAGLASVGVIFLYVVATTVLSLALGVSIPIYLGYFIVFLCIISAAYFGIRFSLSTFVVVGDNAKALPAVKRSGDYIRGYWWPVFWRLLFMGAAAVLLTMAILILGIFLGTVLNGNLGAVGVILLALVNIVLYAILPPLYISYCYQVYTNLKAIKGESKIPADQSNPLLMTIIILVLIGFVVGAFYFMSALPGIYMRRVTQQLPNSTFPFSQTQLSSGFETIAVSGSAMSPTLTNGEYITVDTKAMQFNRGDIIVYRYSKDPTQMFLKRVIGLPGEQVEIKNGGVYINGQLYNDSQYTNGTMTYGQAGVTTLASDEYYVLGDNRTASSDSRVSGPVNKSLIVGKFVSIISKPNQSTQTNPTPNQ